jgi:hypothetical protein
MKFLIHFAQKTALKLMKYINFSQILDFPLKKLYNGSVQFSIKLWVHSLT